MHIRKNKDLHADGIGKGTITVIYLRKKFMYE